MLDFFDGSKQNNLSKCSSSINMDSQQEEKGDFQACLSRLNCDVLLMFGRDDPWCKPAFAKKMLNALSQRTGNNVHRYVELGM